MTGITSHETQQVADLSLAFIRRFVEPRPAETRELARAGVG